MARTWEQEKTYRQRRAKQLSEEMDQAIDNRDKERFIKAFQTAMNYMTKKERDPYFKRFLSTMIGRA